MIFEKKRLRKTKIGFKIQFLTKFLDDSAWFCVERLKKHSFETKNQNKYNEYNKICKQIPLLGPFKGPCTLPYATVCRLSSSGLG